MIKVTFDQVLRMFNIASALGVSCERLQALSNLGLLSDLQKVEDLGSLDRAALRKVLGLTPRVFRLRMGGAETTDQVMATLSFSVSKLITQTRFPIALSEHCWEDEIELVQLRMTFSEKEGLEELEKRGLLRPSCEHAIRFAQQYWPATTRGLEPYVVFLHEAWKNSWGDRHVLCLCRQWNRRELLLSHVDHFRGDQCVLSGVRPRS